MIFLREEVILFAHLLRRFFFKSIFRFLGCRKHFRHVGRQISRHNNRGCWQRLRRQSRLYGRFFNDRLCRFLSLCLCFNRRRLSRFPADWLLLRFLFNEFFRISAARLCRYRNRHCLRQLLSDGRRGRAALNRFRIARDLRCRQSIPQCSPAGAFAKLLVFTVVKVLHIFVRELGTGFIEKSPVFAAYVVAQLHKICNLRSEKNGRHATKTRSFRRGWKCGFGCTFFISSSTGRQITEDYMIKKTVREKLGQNLSGRDDFRVPIRPILFGIRGRINFKNAGRHPFFF